MLSEDLQHVPVELHGLFTVRLVDGSLNKLLILINTSLINNGMWVHSGSFGCNVFSAELEPFIKGNDGKNTWHPHFAKSRDPDPKFETYERVQYETTRRG